MLTLSWLIASGIAAADEEPREVDVVGTLRTGIVAIGGETTGATITAEGVTWELAFGNDPALRLAADKLNGKSVRVQGSLERRRGVEIEERWIVTVSKLEAAGKAVAKETAKPALQATLKRSGNRVRFETAGELSVIGIDGKAGINSAQLRRQAASWPNPMVVRLHLKGLEMFRARGAAVAVEWSVSSSGEQPARVALREGDAEKPIEEGDPYFTKPRIEGGGGKVPLAGGYFEVPLPAKLFEGNPEEITLEWIDFYR